MHTYTHAYIHTYVHAYIYTYIVRIWDRSASVMPLNLQTKVDPHGMGDAVNNFHVNGQWMPEIKIRPGIYIHNNIHQKVKAF